MTNKFQAQVESANKLQLRELCKEARIPYGKLDNAGMRKALLDSARTIHDFATHGKHHCPHCETHLGNGVLHYADVLDTNPREAAKMVLEFECMACGGEFGEKLNHKRAKPAEAPKTKGIKIQKDREERNGIKRPSEGGKCAAVWSMLDRMQLESEEPITLKAAKTQGAAEGMNANNVAIEFYLWRKFTA